MIGLILAAVIASLKARLLAGAAVLEADLLALLSPFLPAATISAIIKPAIDGVLAWITTVLDQIDVAALEKEALGRMVEVIKTGKSEASHDPGIDFGG